MIWLLTKHCDAKTATLAIALLLAACDGGPATVKSGCQPIHNCWEDADLSPPSVMATAVDYDIFMAEAPFTAGDYVINCPTGEHTTILEIQYPPDGTAHLATNQWVEMIDLANDGPYGCEDI